MDKEELRRLYVDCRRKCGASVTDAILAGFGAATFDELKPLHYQKAAEAFDAATPQGDPAARNTPKTMADLDPTRIYARWNSPKHAPRKEGES